MQTEAEKYLIKIIKKILILSKRKQRIINLGAAKSVVIEEAILKSGYKFICDRCDIENCQVNKPYIKNSYICSLENMIPIADNKYDLAFANFVMEHVVDSEKTAKEINRIVKPGGNLVISLSNPCAPEFKLAKITPTWFHQLFRQKKHDNAYPVNYVYKNINNFINIMEKNGWILQEKKYFPAIYSYLHNFFIINIIGLLYDKVLLFLNIKSWLGHVVLHFQSNFSSNIDKNQ